MVAIPLKIELSHRNNLASHLNWFLYLSSGKFATDYQDQYESGDNQVAMVKATRKIIDEEIYAFPEGSYKRTYDLYNSWDAVELSSVGGAGGSDGDRGIAVYSDPGIAPSEAGTKKGEISYAVFFEKPEFNTFIQDQEDRPAIRPYFGIVQEAVKQIAEDRALKAIKKVLTVSKKLSTVK